MDRDTDVVIDLLLRRVSRSALASLEETVDVDRRWRELREAGPEPDREDRDGNGRS